VKWDCKRETVHSQYLEKYFNIFTKEKCFIYRVALKSIKLVIYVFRTIVLLESLLRAELNFKWKQDRKLANMGTYIRKSRQIVKNEIN
jgi:hypothetical protein